MIKEFIKISTVFIITIILSGVFFSTLVFAHSKKEKITLCHKTHSETNPWVKQTVKANELQSHLDNGDFVIDENHACPPEEETPTPTAIAPSQPVPTITPCYVIEKELDEDCITPTQEVTPTPTEEITPTPTEEVKGGGTAPTFAGSSTNAPQCSSANVVKEAANPHVYRNGDKAIVKWWPTEGNKVNIYYKQNSSSNWQYSLTQSNNGYAEINGLGKMDITFAIQQVNDCGGGTVSSVSKPIVDGVSNTWVLFR